MKVLTVPFFTIVKGFFVGLHFDTVTSSYVLALPFVIFTIFTRLLFRRTEERSTREHLSDCGWVMSWVTVNFECQPGWAMIPRCLVKQCSGCFCITWMSVTFKSADSA